MIYQFFVLVRWSLSWYMSTWCQNWLCQLYQFEIEQCHKLEILDIYFHCECQAPFHHQAKHLWDDYLDLSALEKLDLIFWIQYYLGQPYRFDLFQEYTSYIWSHQLSSWHDIFCHSRNKDFRASLKPVARHQTCWDYTQSIWNIFLEHLELYEALRDNNQYKLLENINLPLQMATPTISKSGINGFFESPETLSALDNLIASSASSLSSNSASSKHQSGIWGAGGISSGSPYRFANSSK